MSQRGRNYYDPIVQQPYDVTEDLSRIEVFQDPADPTLRRWCSHLVTPEGAIGSEDICDSDRDRVIIQAQERWPGLAVHELQEPGEDSTWEGMGPSPRMWDQPKSVPMHALQHGIAEIRERMDDKPAAETSDEQIQIRAIQAEPGIYMHVDDVKKLLHSYAVQYDTDGNPSGALALRMAAEMLG